jgi:hypothetical protein
MFKFIANIFSSVGAYFRKLFKSAKDFLAKEIPAAIAVTELLKAFIDSPATPILTALIPGDVDDKIAARIKQILPKLLVELKIAQAVTAKSSNDEIIQAAVAHLQTLSGDKRYGYWLMISSHLSKDLSDGKLTWPEIVTLVQSVKNPMIKK